MIHKLPLPIALCAALAATFTSCDTRSDEQKAEDQLQAKHPYNRKVQGAGHETHENQFYISRGKPAVGAQMDSAASAGEPTEVKIAGDTLQKK